jgi:hypothetical protein
MTEKEVIHKNERFTFQRCRLFALRLLGITSFRLNAQAAAGAP